MEFKTFLGKYRVAHDEMELAAPPPANDALGAETATLLSETAATAALYRGVETDSGRDVAVEVIPAFSLKRAVREQLEAEALAARKINHINIPALYDFGVEDDHLIYVTEYFDGTSAEEWVNAHGPMPTGAVFRIALQVVGAMGVASIHKITHHALNPGNLILVPGQTPEGDWPLVKVSHFVGVAPTFSSADTSVASFDKSSHYASPEQLQGGTVDFRSEIYSLGASMWFLLTGAPPLTTPKGPGAVQPATVGRGADKLSAMPKKVRRLLAQMLSANPEARPEEPLAFYRQIQDCLAQVDRRETMVRRLGVPFLSRSKTAALPGRRPFPTKLVAVAAIVLAIAAIASIWGASYLRHQRIRQAEEPIGTPIGVSQPVVAAAPPLTAIAPTVAPAPPQPEQPANPVQIAQTSSIENRKASPAKVATAAGSKIENAEAIKPLPSAPEQTVPATVAEQTQPPPVSDSTAVAAANNQPAAPPVTTSAPAIKPLPSAPAETTRAIVAEQNQPPPPPTTANAPAIAPTPPQPETSAQTVSIENRKSKVENAQEPPTVAANESKPIVEERSKPATKRAPEVREEKSKPSEVAVARPVTPDVRRAEPAEDLEEVAPPSSIEKTEQKSVTVAKPKRERARKQKPAVEEGVIPRAEAVNEEERIAAEPMPPRPGNRTRARFIGVTPEGNWMFVLPSKKIVIMPPPPGG